jgi:phosphoribosylformimino-5-aminoimidazole carboxamide ribotide isomerase
MLIEHRERFQVIPAVDVLGGEAVRLERGAFDRVVARDADPLALVERLVAAGAGLIHVVDLGGSRSGRIRPELFRRLAAAAAPAAIQAAGGVRSPSDAEQLIEAGAARVVIGTAAFTGRMALSRYTAALGDRLVVAIDVRDGLLAVRGWEQTTRLTVEEAVARCAQAGVARLLCTAIERDGTLGGPALDLLAQVRERSGLPVLAAGGIRSQTDLEAVATVGCEGAIVGRAVLEGLLPLPQPDRPAVGNR